MRKIQFNQDTIEKIRAYVEDGHTLDETCNRFTLKYDTLRRVMYENNISTSHINKSNGRIVSEEDVNIICNLYEHTDTRMEDIIKATKLPNYVVQHILRDNFSEQYIAKRKARLYSKSKSGDNCPMKGKKGPLHHNYKGLIDDGQGYLMVLNLTMFFIIVS